MLIALYNVMESQGVGDPELDVLSEGSEQVSTRIGQTHFEQSIVLDDAAVLLRKLCMEGKGALCIEIQEITCLGVSQENTRHETAIWERTSNERRARRSRQVAEGATLSATRNGRRADDRCKSCGDTQREEFEHVADARGCAKETKGEERVTEAKNCTSVYKTQAVDTRFAFPCLVQSCGVYCASRSLVAQEAAAYSRSADVAVSDLCK